MKPFQIRNDQTDQTFGLTDIDVFERDYKPNGFRILEVQPDGYEKPQLKPKAKAAEEKPARATTTPAPEKPIAEAK